MGCCLNKNEYMLWDSIEAMEEDTDYTRWMTGLPTELTTLPINQLAIPGTHDSGAYYLNENSPVNPKESGIIKWISKFGWGKDIVIRWSLTQKATITEQLTAGVRYFDMRTGYLVGPDDFFFTHGVYGDKISKMLEEMKSFCEANPKEVLIVDFNHFYSFTDSLHERFVSDVILKNFKDKAYCHGSSYEINMSLKDFWGKGKQFIIRYCDAKSTNKNKELWPTEIIDSPWFDTDSITKLISDLDSRFDTLKHDTINVFQAILTPQSTTIFFHFTSSLEKALAVPGNVHIKGWLEKVLNQRKKGTNVVICDFEVLSQLIPSILNLNNLLVAEVNQIKAIKE